MKHKASILAITLIILSIILTTALAVSLTAIKQKNASLGSGKSNLAFQNADKGAEEILNAITQSTGAKVSDINWSSWGLNCISVSGSPRVVGTGFTVELKKDDGSTIDCNSSTNLSEISTLKSVGQEANKEARAIEAVVAAGLCSSGTYVGATSSNDGSGVNGYSGGDVKCGSAVTGSHMCDAHEMITSIHCNVSIPSGGWYSSGIAAIYYDSGIAYNLRDCSGWKTNAANEYGSYWDASNKKPIVSKCSNSEKILCCK